MSKTPHQTNRDNRNEPVTKADVQAIVQNEIAPVAETVDQLVTTDQVKPAAAPNQEVAPTPDYDAEHVKKLNVSQTVRYLHAQGFTRGQIVKNFPKIKGRSILYQHVRNVLVTPVKTNG